MPTLDIACWYCGGVGAAATSRSTGTVERSGTAFDRSQLTIAMRGAQCFLRMAAIRPRGHRDTA
jgi:hypothetical protein